MKPLQPFNIDFSGINLVEASAGTGKTYNIASLYIRALVELDHSVSRILVVTYTEAATKELKDRLLRRLRESMEVLKESRKPEEDQFLNELIENVTDRPQAIDRLTKAIRNFDEAAIYTIHGFCYQVLQEQAFESRALYDAEMIGDDSDLVLEAVDDYWRNWVKESSENISKRPLLKLLTDKGCYPEKLADELSSLLGKPYLKIIPEKFELANLNEVLDKLQSNFKNMKEIWELNREEIFELLNRGALSYYREDWLQSWLHKMDDLLTSDTAPIAIFDQFSKFTQTTIDNSLKKSVKKGTIAPQHKFFKLADEFERIAKSLQSYDVKFKKELLLHLRRALNDRKEELQVLSYDDLLLKLQQSLQNEQNGKKLAAKLNGKYPIALVDEFQDTDPAQYDIFRLIYQPAQKKSALFMIGDPKQSIYSFRGADVFAYLKAKRDANPNKIFNLGHNYRSSPELISAINTLFGNHQNPFILGNIAFNPVEAGKEHKAKGLLENNHLQPPVRFRSLKTGEEEPVNKGTAEEKAAKDTAGEIKRLIDGGKNGKVTIGSEVLKAKDIAVLVQSHKQAGMVSKALQDEDIKSVQYSQESVFQSDEALQLQIVLKAIADPANEQYIKTALSVLIMKFSAVELIEMEEDEARWLEILDQFASWHKQWQQKGFQYMFRSFLKEAGVYDHLIKSVDGERSLTNVLHLGELLQAEDRQRKGGPRGLLKWLARKRKEETGQQEEAQLRLESDEELVKIVTMHRSKGLEYPVVFCPFLWKGPKFEDRGQPLVYHDPKDLERTFLDFKGKADSRRNEKRWLVAREALAERMRLAYVAMTRAEYCCYLTWIYAKKSEFSPLGYLFLESERVFPLMKKTISKEGSKKEEGHKVNEMLQRLCKEQKSLFSFNASPESDIKRSKTVRNGAPKDLESKLFSRSTPLESSYKVSSFSSLTAGKSEDHLPDYDQFIDSSGEQFVNSEKTIFTFPKGPQPGTCIHQIFEDINFRDLENAVPVVHQNLESYGIDRQWEKVVTQMLKTVTDKPLLQHNNRLKLSALSSNDFIPEVEFYFKSRKTHFQQLCSIIRETGFTDGPVNRVAEKGFLKGFIDLTFQFENKFYLLDYKTNFLGDSHADYSPENLEKEMREKFYDLQYHIYTIALHRYLKLRMPDYSYRKNFGGAFYLFLRGISEDGRSGIYYDRPDLSVVQQLDEYILEGEEV